MYILITILIVVAALVLILVVLVQNSKGGGLSSAFSSSNNIMGVRKTTDFVEKATWGLAAFLIIMSLVSVKFLPSQQSSGNFGIKSTAPSEVPSGQDAPDVGGSQAPANESAPAPQQ